MVYKYDALGWRGRDEQRKVCLGNFQLKTDIVDGREYLECLIPRLSRNANIHRVESQVAFLRKHDVIKIGQKQKSNVMRVIQPTTLQRSVCMIFNAR